MDYNETGFFGFGLASIKREHDDAIYLSGGPDGNEPKTCWLEIPLTEAQIIGLLVALKGSGHEGAAEMRDALSELLPKFEMECAG